MSDPRKRPILALLTSHWVTMLGVALVTSAGFSWLFVLPLQLRGHASNPYIGLLVFIFIPVLFVLGLVLIALGIFLTRRHIRRGGEELLATVAAAQDHPFAVGIRFQTQLRQLSRITESLGSCG